MSSRFLGSGTSILCRTFAPIDDRLDYDESEDELRASTSSLGSAGGATLTLEDVGYDFTPSGGIRLKNMQEDLAPVWKKLKVPADTKLVEPAHSECGICLLDYEPSELVTTDCQHHYCRVCMDQYLFTQSGDVSNIFHQISHVESMPGQVGSYLRVRHCFGIVCPHPLCARIIEAESYQKFASEATWARFLQICLTFTLTQLHERGELTLCAVCGSYMQGCECTSEMCRRRKEQEEEKRRNRLYRAWLDAEKRGAALLREWATMSAARVCPKCGILIEKNGGCDHMQCRHCKTSYNWSQSVRYN